MLLRRFQLPAFLRYHSCFYVIIINRYYNAYSSCEVVSFCCSEIARKSLYNEQENERKWRVHAALKQFSAGKFVIHGCSDRKHVEILCTGPQ
jgi:hypothetical protein